MRSFALLALGLALALPCGANTADRMLAGVGFEQRIGAAVPAALPFADEAGAPVRLDRFLGARPVLLVLAYYRCPNLCGTMLSELAARLRDLDLAAGRDFQVVVVSFDPDETAAIARAKKAQYRVPGRAWHFLTGTPRSIHELTAAVGFRFKPDAAAGGFLHPAGAVILTPQARVSSYLFAFEPDNAALRYGLIAASGNRLGSPLDRLWLLCHRFDPATGRYTSLVTQIERGLGLTSVAAFAGVFVWLCRRTRKER